jgi:hypothetical protein
LGPEWYGNRAFINIETVHPGDGSAMPEVQEKAVVAAAALLVAVIGTDATGVIGHYDGRGSKIDPYWSGDRYRIAHIQDQVQAILDGNHLPTEGDDMPTHFTIGMTDRYYEPVVWLLAALEGGSIDPNANSQQIATWLPWKTDVKHVDREDLELVARILGLSDKRRDELLAGGLYATGREVAALEQLLING